MLKRKLAQTSTICSMLLITLGAAFADDGSLKTCATSDGVIIQVAQSEKSSAIVARTRTSITFKSIYKLRKVSRDGQTQIIVSLPGVPGSGTVSCHCASSGTCFPTWTASKVTCKSQGCTSGCIIGLSAPPPPPPNP
jgi:hypothetical protein